MTVAARCPAKVNLQLSIGPRRTDGYHPLVTVFQAVGLYDEVRVSPRPAGSGVSLDLTRPRSDVPADETNLAWRAAAALAEAAGVPADVHIEIAKGIPVAGGMAGGSADAAAALVACCELWDVDRAIALDVAPALGADVPFCLHGGTAIGTGRGDIVTPALARGPLWWVFALADGGLSTPDVYGEFDRLRPTPAPPALDEPLMAALLTGDPAAIGPALRNDLQEAALSLRPALGRVFELAEDYSAAGCIVSGSGPTCALLARSEEHALDLAVALTSAQVCATVARAVGPVPGAQLI